METIGCMHRDNIVPGLKIPMVGMIYRTTLSSASIAEITCMLRLLGVRQIACTLPTKPVEQLLVGVVLEQVRKHLLLSVLWKLQPSTVLFKNSAIMEVNHLLSVVWQ